MRPRHPLRVIFVVTLLAYVALTVAVIRGTALDILDRRVAGATIGRHDATLHRLMSDYVLLGQRGPSTEVASVWVAWLCLRRRSIVPALTVAIALLLLNASVGGVKLAVGRVGPFVTDRAHDVFAGGDIYPSGHVSNAVVLYGVLASLAIRHRRPAAALATFVALTVGVAAVYLDYHWVTDVLGGWFAGILVLCVTPACSRAAHRMIRWCIEPVAGWGWQVVSRRADRVP